MSNYIEIQKIIISVFMELMEANEKQKSKVIQYGWSQRNALISHVYSNYQKHEELQEKKLRWEIACREQKVLDELFEFLKLYRDLYGYFPEYVRMLRQFDLLIQQTAKDEQYEEAIILQKWRKKFPD